VAALIPLQAIRDARSGTLVVMESGKQVPFDMPRLFLLRDIGAGAVRGDHAHRAQHQFLVPVHGALEVEAVDRGGTARHLLEDPAVGLHAPPLTWLRIKALKPDSSCLVLASGRYDEADYVRDFAEFQRLIAG
jgi:UDP-2-acetamido-3-amino-2,3-dideoxy-glucuronate N-acetyltransferase